MSNREEMALMNIIKSKNVEIKALREAERAHESVNVILAAYIAILVKKTGRTVVPKSAVAEALGQYLVSATSDVDNYVIEVIDSEAEATCGAKK